MFAQYCIYIQLSLILLQMTDRSQAGVLAGFWVCRQSKTFSHYEKLFFIFLIWVKNLLFIPHYNDTSASNLASADD